MFDIKRLLYIIPIFFLFLSCRKEDSLKQPKPIAGQELARIDCWYDIYDSTSLGGIMRVDSTIYADFFDRYGHPTEPKEILVNNIELVANSHGINMHKMNWNITGHEYFSSSSFSCAPPHPIYNGYGLLPDTLSKSNFSFVVNALCNVNYEYYLGVYQNTGAALNHLPRIYPATITVSSSDPDLAKFTPGSSIEIQLSLQNRFLLNDGVRYYDFSLRRFIHKYVYLKP